MAATNLTVISGFEWAVKLHSDQLYFVYSANYSNKC